MGEQPSPALPGAVGREVHVARSAGGVELYFPPLRSLGVAIPLALLGAISALVPAIVIGALLPTLIANAGNLLGAVLISSFVLPFVAFGAMLVAVAIYMLGNSLHVRVDADSVETTRLLFGAVVRRRRIPRTAIAAIEAQIPTRYQSLFPAAPCYQLYARTVDGKRAIIAETLRGEQAMEHVKALIENPTTAVAGASEPVEGPRLQP